MLRKKERATGYYWVQWSYSGTLRDDVWRVAYYNHRLGYWTLDGDTRTFYDTDFIAVDPRPVPRNWIVGSPSRLWLYLLTAFLIFIITSCMIDVYKFIISLMR